MSYNLVISHKSKYVYYSIPKTATTSIKKYLEKYTLIDIGSFKLENGYDIEYNNEWNNYYQFAFVRNPWDRVLSCFLDKTKQCIGKSWALEYYKIYYDCSFEEFIEQLNGKNIVYDGHLMPQTMLINNHVNFTGKFENLSQDLSIVQNILSLPKEDIPYENITCHEHYSQYYNKSTRDKIYYLYKEDIERFNYEFY
jgi:hypothetical protein